MRKTSMIALSMLTFACLLWGLEFILIEMVLESVSESFFTFIRLAVATLMIGAFYFLSRKREKIEKKDWLMLIISGSLGKSVYFFLENMGVARTSGAIAAMILATVPIMGLAADAIFFKHKLTKKKVVAMAVSVVGVLLIVTEGTGSIGGGTLSGYLCMLGAALTWTAFVVMSKPLLEKYSALTVLFWQALVATIPTIPVALVNLPSAGVFTPKVILLTLLVGGFCTAGAQFLYLFSLKTVSVTMATLFENFIPVVTVFFGFVFFRTVPSVYQVVGGAIIIAAVLAVSGIFSRTPRGAEGEERLPDKGGKAAVRPVKEHS